MQSATRGGVGKTLLAASLAKTFDDSGYSVIAIGADPAASLAAEIGIEKIAVVGNKVRSDQNRAFIAACFPGKDIMGYIPYDPALVAADINGQPVLDASSAINEAIVKIFVLLQTDTPLGYHKKLTVN